MQPPGNPGGRTVPSPLPPPPTCLLPSSLHVTDHPFQPPPQISQKSGGGVGTGQPSNCLSAPPPSFLFVIFFYSTHDDGLSPSVVSISPPETNICLFAYLRNPGGCLFSLSLSFKHCSSSSSSSSSYPSIHTHTQFLLKQTHVANG